VAVAACWAAEGRAHAATWGSFDTTRLAYDLADLAGERHDALRIQITARGDEVGAATGELTADYLAGVDVFYTSMLSDGTGPSAGAAGTLSLSEISALQEWVAVGGTLIVTVDSNGFDGPFPAVYDTWLGDYGVGAFAFIFEQNSGAPFVVHPITEQVATIEWDGVVTFDFGADGFLLANGPGGTDPLIAVFEPATGFAAGGRLLVIGDHNMLTDNYIDFADNLRLAQNIAAWAAGECGNGIVEDGEVCDDGNLDDGDDCDASCGGGGGATDSSGGGDTAADSTGDAPGTTTGDDAGGSTESPPVPADDDAGLGSSGGSGSETGAQDEGGGDGCGCRGGGSPGRTTAWWLVVFGLVTMRRARRSAR
jgi:MYXO-CTERM domain-containing protein